jgi:hypothetical protein
LHQFAFFGRKFPSFLTHEQYCNNRWNRNWCTKLNIASEWDHAIEFLVSMTDNFRVFDKTICCCCCRLRITVIIKYCFLNSGTRVIIDSCCKLFSRNLLRTRCSEQNRRMLRVFLALLIEMFKCASKREENPFLT